MLASRGGCRAGGRHAGAGPVTLIAASPTPPPTTGEATQAEGGRLVLEGDPGVVGLVELAGEETGRHRGSGCSPFERAAQHGATHSAPRSLEVTKD